jgi:hypothetical protein
VRALRAPLTCMPGADLLMVASGIPGAALAALHACSLRCSIQKEGCLHSHPYLHFDRCCAPRAADQFWHHQFWFGRPVSVDTRRPGSTPLCRSWSYMKALHAPLKSWPAALQSRRGAD